MLENSSFQGIVDNERVLSAVYAEGRTTAEIDLYGDPWLKQVLNFVIEGIWHIWIGFDHVLFLVTLLLTATLVYTAEGWQPVATFKSALLKLLTIVTPFLPPRIGTSCAKWKPAKLVSKLEPAPLNPPGRGCAGRLPAC